MNQVEQALAHQRTPEAQPPRPDPRAGGIATTGADSIGAISADLADLADLAGDAQLACRVKS